MRKSTTILALAGCCVLWFSPAAPGATIAWDAAMGISGDGNVSTDGTTINAVNLGKSGFADTTTVNTVTFTGASPNPGPGGPLTSGNFTFTGFQGSGRFSTSSAPYANLPAEYQDLLESGINTVTGTYTLTISSLTVGSTYEFEFWSDNSTTDTGQITATAGNAVTLSSNASGLSGGLGQFAVGTFTADSSTETITFAPSDQYAYLNGAQLSVLSTAPEPGTTALFGLALAGMGALSRRRV